MQSGQYVLTVRDLVEDLRGNALDGDFDGVAGTDPASTGYGGYHFNFIVAESDDVLGPETRVNENPLYIQFFSEPQGTGYGRETSTTSVAVDDDGDYVVVWTSLGQDDPNDPNGAGVYLRLYDRSGAPRTGEVRVNNLTSGDQRNAAVAMDADGDFIVTWEAQNADGNWDVYAQRFDAAGNRIANDRLDRIDVDPYRNIAGSEHIEVLVNTTANGEQFNPSVAVDNFGNYVIVWGSAGQQFGYFNNVNAQLFDYRGQPVGDEFQVNAASLPGVERGRPERRFPGESVGGDGRQRQLRGRVGPDHRPAGRRGDQRQRRGAAVRSRRRGRDRAVHRRGRRNRRDRRRSRLAESAGGHGRQRRLRHRLRGVRRRRHRTGLRHLRHRLRGGRHGRDVAGDQHADHQR